jgi:hypothetical protein
MHPLYEVKNLIPVANTSTNDLQTDDFIIESPDSTDSEGRLRFELSQEDKEFFEETRRLGAKLLEEIEIYEQC